MKPKFDRVVAVDALIDAALRKPAQTLVSEDGRITTTDPGPAAEHAPVEDPWIGANPRVLSFFQVRMPEPLKLKIEWLTKHQAGEKRLSQHMLVLEALTREIDRMVAKAKKDGGGK